MDKRKNKYRDPWDQETYSTGSTNPPKSHGGKVALLFAVGIFCCGVFTTLGLMRIRLFTLNAFPADPTVTISFHGTGSEVEPSHMPTSVEKESLASKSKSLGITGEVISPFHQSFYHWPAGFYITEVTKDSPADKNNITPGDILVSVGGISAGDISAVRDFLAGCKSGQQIRLILYRNGTQFPIDLILSD